MTIEHPKTLPEWKAYAETLSGETLREVAKAANSTRFVKELQDEGYAATEIHAIMVYIARRFPATEQRPPDGFYDLFELAKTTLPDDLN